MGIEIFRIYLAASSAVRKAVYAPFSLLKRLLLGLIIISISFNSAAQTITAFSPTSGPVGTTVTITGTGFNTVAADNIVYFGATKANVSSSTAVTLIVTVPSGANFMYITVTNLATHLTAYSTKPFNVTVNCSAASSFAPKVNFQGGSHNIEIFDMDGDGRADLVIPDYFNNTFCVTRNISSPGIISFAPKVTFPWAAGGQPNELSIGDFDGDGNPDVALGGNGGGTFVSVYRNTSTPGNISFAARLDFAASSGQGNGNKVIDIDKDGKPDIISVHWSGNCVWILRNTSTGPGIISFAPGVSFATTTQPHKVDVGDLDGDGSPDVVITSFTSNTMSVFRNTSTTGSISFATRQDYAPGTVPYYIHLGDLDGDTKADVVVVNRDVANMAVYRNISFPGTITLAAKQTFATPAGTMTHYGVAYGDLDGDGKPDIAVGNYTLNITSIFINTSVPGTISFATRTDIPSGIAFDVGIDDFDGDSRPDLVVTNSGTTVSIIGNLCTLIPLPIELLSFTGVNVDETVLLNWSTGSEINNDYFTVERSVNGTDFEKIGQLHGAGNSNSIQNYSFVDMHPFNEINYYRLLQTDFDGHSEFSKIISVVTKIKTSTVFCNYNAYENNIVLVVTGKDQITNTISIYDVNGKLIYSTEALNNIMKKINANAFPKGIYFMHIYNTNEQLYKHKLILY